MNDNATKFKSIPPKASILIESMRDIGYSLHTAVADIIDNSITAKARRVDLLTDTHGEIPAIGILDDGMGMTKNELWDAMRPGSRSPHDERGSSDLGRFGLGLKTASFSQCRRLTVVTRKNKKISCAVWDLDTVAREDDWVIEIPRSYSNIPWIEKLGNRGTLILWQKIDRLDDESDEDKKDMKRLIDEMTDHVRLVFHRYMAKESTPKNRRVGIYINDRQLEPFDPFHSNHPATQHHQEEKFMLGGEKISIKPVTLPHHGKVSDKEWDEYAWPGTGGYTENQGFYLYRNRRLVVYGTWFGLANPLESTKLSRVRIDITNRLDSAWNIDVKKSSAKPPPLVREKLKKIIREIGLPSKRAYSERARLSRDVELPVWLRYKNKNQIHYGLNEKHPIYANLIDSLESVESQELKRYIKLVETSLPIDSLIADINQKPENMGAPSLNEEEFIELVNITYNRLRETGEKISNVRLMMKSVEPFNSKWDVVSAAIEDMEDS